MPNPIPKLRTCFLGSAPADPSLASRVFVQKRPRSALYFTPASSHPPTSYPATTLGSIFSAIPWPRDQPTHFVKLCSLLPINHKQLPDLTELFQGGGGCRQMLGQHASTGLLYLPFSRLLFRPWRCGSRGQGGPSPGLAEEKRAGPSLLKMWSRRARLCWDTLFQVAQKPCQDECGKTLYTVEAAVVLQRNPNQVLSDLCAVGFVCADVLLCDLLKNHFLGQEVNLVKSSATTWLTP